MARLCACSVVLLALVAGATAQTQFMEAEPPRELLDAPVPFEGGCTADLDGDGKPEIVTVDPRGVVIHRSQPDGSWLAGLVALPATLPRTVRAADLDGDGDPDLVVSARSTGESAEVFVVHNDPAGPIALAAPFGPVQGAVPADLDGDGRAELVVGWRRGFPDGVSVVGLVAGQLQVLPGPAGVAGGWPLAGDFDGDGDADVVLLEAWSPPRLLRNDGGTLTAAGVLSGMGVPVHGAAGDLDGDGADDLALLDRLGNATLSWGGATGLLPAPSSATGLRIHAADVDGDGAPDLVASGPSGLTWHRNTGGRRFREEPPFARAAPLTGEVVGDFDGDMRADLVLSFGDPERAVLGIYGGDRLFADASTQTGFGPAPPGWNRAVLSVADMDGDGRADVLFDSGHGTEWLRSLGQGRYAAAQVATVNSPDTPASAHQIDLDGDGDLDHVRVGRSFLCVLRNDGAGGLATAQELPLQTAGDRLRAGDLDGDGDVDFLHVDQQAFTIVINNGGALQQPLRQPWAMPPLVGVTTVELGDLDGDGDLDFLTNGSTGTGGAVAMANDGTGRFTPAFPTAQFGLSVDCLLAADADGDGDQDLFVGGGIGSAALRLFANDGTGGFTDVTAMHVPAVAGRVLRVLFADLDQDGHRDLLLLGGFGGRGAAVLVADGTGRFLDLSGGRWTPSSTPLSLVEHAQLRDADGDGDLDVAMSGLGRIPPLAINHTRQLVSRSPPRVGQFLGLDLFSGPRYSPPGIGLVVVGLQSLPRPVPVPVAGLLDLDPAAGIAVLAAPVLGTVGVARVFAPIPNLSQLAGVELFLQGAVLSQGPQPSGLTDSVYEIVLP